MEKEIPDSITTVNLKPDYAPSEGFGSEAPPAYHRPKSTAVQITKIVAVTVVLVSFVLGGFVLASAYVNANASCRHLEQELEFMSEALDRYQMTGPGAAPLQPEALVQEETSVNKKTKPETAAVPLEEDTKVVAKDDNALNTDYDSNNSEESDSDSDDSSDEEQQDRFPVQFKFPLHIDLDDLAGAMMDRHQRSRMNCVVEKKRAEEVVDHKPKTLNLPFGVNLTTDPRYEHISGERIAIICESGNVDRNEQPQQRPMMPPMMQQPIPMMPPQQQPQHPGRNFDEDTDTVMIQPVMIPIPPSQYATHMNQQMSPQSQQQMVPPMHPMEQMRPPMMPPMAQQQQQRAPEQNGQSHLPPSAVLHHIAQQIIAQQLEARHRQAMAMAAAQQEAEEAQQEQRSNEIPIVTPLQRVQEVQRMSRMPIPQAILNAISGMPSSARGEVIVAVSSGNEASGPNSGSLETSSQEQAVSSNGGEASAPQQQQTEQQEERMIINPQFRVMQLAREGAQGMNGRQTYARGLPVDIPVPMMQQEAEERVAAAAAAQEEPRPHYVHPRSVRSVDEVLKRTKKCACDCAC